MSETPHSPRLSFEPHAVNVPYTLVFRCIEVAVLAVGWFPLSNWLGTCAAWLHFHVLRAGPLCGSGSWPDAGVVIGHHACNVSATTINLVMSIVLAVLTYVSLRVVNRWKGKARAAADLGIVLFGWAAIALVFAVDPGGVMAWLSN